MTEFDSLIKQARRAMFKKGTRVQWIDNGTSLSSITKGKPDTTTHLMIGTIYRVDKDRVAVLPDSWAREGKTEGVLKRREVLALYP